MGREMRPCLIFGAVPVPPPLAKAAAARLLAKPFVLAADAGWKQALACGFVPQLVVGDFDSGEKPDAEPWRCAGGGETLPQVVALPPEKDDTDLYYAAKEALRLEAGQVLMLGALGGRLDHSLASLSTLYFLRQNGIQASIEDAAATAHCVLPGEVLRLDRREGVYLSVFPIGEKAEGVFENGVKYPLANAVLHAGHPLGVSNEFAGETAEIGCHSGGLYVLMVRRNADTILC